MAVVRTPDASWESARWVIDALADHLRARVGVPDEVLALIDRARQDGSYFVDLSACSPVEKQKWAQALRTVREQCVTAGAASFASPEFFDSYLRKLQELIQILS